MNYKYATVGLISGLLAGYIQDYLTQSNNNQTRFTATSTTIFDNNQASFSANCREFCDRFKNLKKRSKPQIR